MAGFMLRVPILSGNGGEGGDSYAGSRASDKAAAYRPSGLGLHAAFCLQQGKEGGRHSDKEPYQASEMDTCKIS
jgi:hypothetical protein